jgi:hypothetical protein
MSIRVIGLDSAIKALIKKGKDAERAILDELEDTATNIESTAINLAPTKFAGIELDADVTKNDITTRLNIKQRIDKVVSNKGFTWKVGVQGTNVFDAYAEFGTGLSAKEILSRPDYTPEIRALAMTFYKNGEGTLRGKPYMFPAYFQHTAQMVQRLKDEVSRAVQ